MNLVPTLESKEIVKITGVSQRMLIHLTERGVINPYIDAKGAGSRRKYTYANLFDIKLYCELSNIGFQFYKIKEIIKDIKHDLESGNMVNLVIIATDYMKFEIDLKKIEGSINESIELNKEENNNEQI